MNKEEARSILVDSMERYRKRTYSELRCMIGDVENDNVVGQSRTEYQLEFQVVWDDMPDGDLRVVASIDDGGLRAFMPLTESFIMNPFGEFVDE